VGIIIRVLALDGRDPSLHAACICACSQQADSNSWYVPGGKGQPVFDRRAQRQHAGYVARVGLPERVKE